MRGSVLLLLVIHSDRLATSSSDLQSKAAVLILVPNRRIGLRPDLARETLIDQR
jgi:hypothetical protein